MIVPWVVSAIERSIVFNLSEDTTYLSRTPLVQVIKRSGHFLYGLRDLVYLVLVLTFGGYRIFGANTNASHIFVLTLIL